MGASMTNHTGYSLHCFTCIFLGFLSVFGVVRDSSAMSFVFTLHWDLFSLVFFSFPISSDLKLARITPNPPQGNFQPDTEFLEFTHECESSSKYPGTAPAADAMQCGNKLHVISNHHPPFPPRLKKKKKAMFVKTDSNGAEVSSAGAVALKSPFCRLLSLTFTPSWAAIWRDASPRAASRTRGRVGRARVNTRSDACKMIETC